MTVEAIRVSPDWLELRERADAAARSRELVEQLLPRLPAGPLVIHDLACGSGAMGRWLGPLLPEPQHWVHYDRDPDLLALAAGETRLSDITRLDRQELAGATLVTASALLDLLTWDELPAVIRACSGPGCPILLTLSVTGRVKLSPEDPLDWHVAAAFNAHQRRLTRRGRLLGPDAVDATVATFRLLGTEVTVQPSPWRLGAGETALIAEWLEGWIGAACEQEPALAADADLYRRRRLRQAEAGRLTVEVDHADLLVLGA